MLINSLEIKECEHDVIFKNMYMLIRNSKEVIVDAYTIQKNHGPFQQFEKKNDRHDLNALHAFDLYSEVEVSM